MNITGCEYLIFGVEDIASCEDFVMRYGLQKVESRGGFARYEALDGTGLELRLIDDPELPRVEAPGSTLRAAVWGVSTLNDLEAIADELSKDRQIRRIGDEVRATDDDGNNIYFRVSQRRPFEGPTPKINVPGQPASRFNERVNFDDHGPALTLGHVVYWTPDTNRAFAFYRDRLGFMATDSYEGNQGLFARARGHGDHHSIFFITNPNLPAGIQHVQFTFGDVQEVWVGGHKLGKAGYKTVFGPGRFELGSNWYWYFETPLGCAFELGADMDQIDENWQPGVHTDMRAAAGLSSTLNLEMSRR